MPEIKTNNRRTQIEKRAESEEALLDAAESLFAEIGVGDTTVQKISSRAGYSRGIVNVHFGSKEAFTERLVERARDRFNKRLNIALQAEGPALNKILTLIDAYFDSIQNDQPIARSFIVLWGASFSEKTPIKGFREADIDSRRNLESLIREGQKDGSINKKLSPEGVALLILGMVRGVGAQTMVAGDEKRIDLKKLYRQAKIFVTAALS